MHSLTLGISLSSISILCKQLLHGLCLTQMQVPLRITKDILFRAGGLCMLRERKNDFEYMYA